MRFRKTIFRLYLPGIPNMKGIFPFSNVNRGKPFTRMIQRSVYKSRIRIPVFLSCIRSKNEHIDVKNEDIFIYYDFIRRYIPFSDKGLSISMDRQTGYVIPSGSGIPSMRVGIEERAANIRDSDTISALQLSAMVHVTGREGG